MPMIHPDDLYSYVRDTCAALGSSEYEQALVADQLVGANLSGHDSHGVGMVPAYVAGALAGELQINSHPTVVTDTGHLSVLDGNMGFGQVNGYEATEHAIERARANGSAIVGLRNSYHIGRIGHWGEQCAAAGMASIHFVNVTGHSPLVAPYGGREARFITNPVCFVIPGGPERDGKPTPKVLLDMATSKIAFGKARVAHEEGRPVPPETMIDGQGRVTTDPSCMMGTEREGALLAFGEHKGSGLAIMAELLGAALIGGPTIQPGHERRPNKTTNNMLSIVIDPAATGVGLDGLATEAQAFLDYVQSSEPREGFDEVLIPGDPENRAREARAAGIPVDDNTCNLLRRAAARAGLADADDRLRP